MLNKWFGTVAVAEAKDLDKIPVMAGPATDEVDAEFQQAYAAVASRVGFAVPHAPVTPRFRSVLSEQGICTYDEKQVRTFLTKQYGPKLSQMPTWGWRPLRLQDTTQTTTYADSLARSPNGCLLGGRTVYGKPIPLPVLLTIDTIQQAFPSAEFFVSDDTTREERVSDPFLLVHLDGQNYIIERWDEPSFRGK